MPSAGEHSENQFDKVGPRGALRDAYLYRREHAMKIPRREFLHLAAGAVALPTVSVIARAQTYPTRPVRLIVGFPPAGSADITARLIGQWLSERLGQQFLVENRPGAGGNLATDAVAKALPDGYTLLLTGSYDAWNGTLYDNLKFSYIRDIAPVGIISREMGVLVVHPSVPAKSVPELIAHAKANPGRITVASSGIGSGTHIYWELFRTMAAVNMLHVPYRGSGPALTDLLGGQVQTLFCALTSSIEYIKAGKLRPLGVTAATRADVLPDIPTIGEFVRGYEATPWYGIGAPKNTPSDIIARLNREINAGLADPRLKARFAELGAAVFPSSPTEFAKLIAEDTEKWRKLIRRANIKAE
jgi:tripartite-type tricarboxylate transporter receptor subunit TctC